MSIYEQAPATSVSSLVADLLKGGRELRPAQVEMALQVGRAIAEGVHLIEEAGTGTGKTMGYLVPILRSGKTAIISTGNKALQDQIFLKDVPFLQAHLMPFGATLVKGVGNYVCRDRLYETGKDLRVFDWYPDFGRLVDLVNDGHRSFSGDFESLDFVIPTELRQRINGDRDACAWSKCDFFDQCYVRKMRDTAQSAQVVIVNHTLLMLDAATEGAILPQCDLLVIDEAHHIVNEATNAFTASVRPTQLASLLQLHAVKERTPETLYNEIGQLAADVWLRVEQMPFGTASKVPFREPMPEALTLANRLVDLVDALRMARPANQTEKESALYDKLLKRVQNLTSALELVFAVQTEGKYVHYVERLLTGEQRVPKFQVCAAPLDVAPFLKEKVFDRWPTVVMASATLATVGTAHAGGNFAYFRKQVGLSQADYPTVIERILPLTFDYKTHALLYIPRNLPEPVYGTGPHVEQYTQAIATEMEKLVTASRGRAFLLFSSGRMLDEVYARIAPTLPFPVLSQRDEMSRAELIRRFRTEPGSVLFGLKSFWEGVDIAGDALSLVVIDKLPFTPTDEPIHEARINLMKARNENWFGGYVLPQVILQLKQGVGRLLRTPHDYGVMALLDTRLVKKGYGREVLNALPPATRVTQIAEVERFFVERSRS
ncbi:ATP-dependent helicase [Reticulibacter mediterranei]|uniref:ATP-dependent helicase n=1 Tax=Reticulibacter mediterranei TaxID=2778369 RepID=A0A8J3J1N2_9CHLR|nr:ATP-dependent DNA helicase [Reticulibacter mediterranei]GHP00666.1 ATP-dependent helicase [Reticulibacter mediterranei]